MASAVLSRAGEGPKIQTVQNDQRGGRGRAAASVGAARKRNLFENEFLMKEMIY